MLMSSEMNPYGDDALHNLQEAMLEAMEIGIPDFAQSLINKFNCLTKKLDEKELRQYVKMLRCGLSAFQGIYDLVED